MAYKVYKLWVFFGFCLFAISIFGNVPYFEKKSFTVGNWKKNISLKCTDHSSDKKETLDIGKTLDLTHLIVGCEKVCKQYGTEFMRKCTSKSFKQWTDFCGDSSGYKSNDITEEIPNPCYRVM